jgi:hypothetical protein
MFNAFYRTTAQEHLFTMMTACNTFLRLLLLTTKPLLLRFDLSIKSYKNCDDSK